LTDIELNGITSIRRALTLLHDKYHVPNIVVSSIPLKEWLIDELPEAIKPPQPKSEDNGYLLCLCSSMISLEGSKDLTTIHVQILPLFPGHYSGVGDLFSALVLGHFRPEEIPKDGGLFQTPLSYATSIALTKTHGIIRTTYQHTLASLTDERQPADIRNDAAEAVNKLKHTKERELRLVQPEGQGIIRMAGHMDAHRMEPWLDFWARRSRL